MKYSEFIKGAEELGFKVEVGEYEHRITSAIGDQLMSVSRNYKYELEVDTDCFDTLSRDHQAKIWSLAITKAQGETVDATQLGVSQELLFNVTRALVGGNGKYDMEQAKSRYGSVVQYNQLKPAVKSLTSSIQLGNNQEGGQGGKYTLTLTYKHPTDHFMRTSAMQYILRGDTGLESAVELFGRDPKPDSKSTYFNHRVSTGQLIGYFEESVTATIQPC